MVAVNVIDPAGPGLVGIGAETGQSSGAFVFDTGDNTQASFITPLSEAGTLNANSWAATDLTIDVIGYFTAPTRTYRYTYDTTGLRASKSLDDEGVTGQGWSKEFTWDTSGGLPLLLAEHRGSQTSYVVYGPQGTPIYQVTATGDVMYFHQDHLGSIRLVTNANGTTKGTLTYNAYGKIKTNTIGWLQEQPLLGYNSQYHDPETGYIYLRARHYDPTTSQFTTVDPLLPLTEEPYGYAGGDPANHWDPWGLDPDPKCPAGQRWSGVSGGCVNTGIIGNYGTEAWTTNPTCSTNHNTEEMSDPFPEPLNRAASYLSPPPTDFIHTMDYLKSYLSFAQAGVGQIIGRVLKSSPRAVRGWNALGLGALIYTLVHSLWVTGDPDPIGSWRGEPPSSSQTPEGIPLWPKTS